MHRKALVFAVPEWTERFWSASTDRFQSVESRMEVAITLARRNVEEATGGPFGAAIFDADGYLVAPGVNMVVPANCSILHAEIVALALAEQALGRFDIGDSGRLEYELVSSTEPCLMCSGAILWSGVSRLVYAARDEDARNVGFDEGPKHERWIEAFEARGVSVVRDVRRSEAVAVLRAYAQSGGLIYNSGNTRGSKV